MKDNQNFEFEGDRQKAKLCPCGKDNKDGKFSPFKGYKDKGYCFSCGETFFPGVAPKRTSNNSKPIIKKTLIKKPEPHSTIPIAFFLETLNCYENNNFTLFLEELVGVAASKEAVARYYVGTSNFWPNATVFWQAAKSNTGKEIRSGKIIQYNIIPSMTSNIGKDCKRNKNNNIPLKWAHKLLGEREYKLKQCLFGEHLLTKDFSIPIAVCESEKTAVIASIYLPQFIWLAAGCLTNLNNLKCKVLTGRKIILFPDLNGFELWTKKAKELSAIATVKVSDLLQRKATDFDRKLGLDLADYLIRFNYKAFL